jgi:hypothetical protein
MAGVITCTGRLAEHCGPSVCSGVFKSSFIVFVSSFIFLFPLFVPFVSCFAFCFYFRSRFVGGMEVSISFEWRKYRSTARRLPTLKNTERGGLYIVPERDRIRYSLFTLQMCSWKTHE